MAFATVPFEDYVVEQGQDRVGKVTSSAFGYRCFCQDCGTPLYVHVEHQADTLDFSLATLDDPEPVRPGFHIFYGSHISWAEPGDDLPRHDKFRPNTRGLS
jgi:hypothetical protein